MLTSLTPTSRAVFTIAAQVSSGKGTPFFGAVGAHFPFGIAGDQHSVNAGDRFSRPDKVDVARDFAVEEIAGIDHFGIDINSEHAVGEAPVRPGRTGAGQRAAEQFADEGQTRALVLAEGADRALALTVVARTLRGVRSVQHRRIFAQVAIEIDQRALRQFLAAAARDQHLAFGDNRGREIQHDRPLPLTWNTDAIGRGGQPPLDAAIGCHQHRSRGVDEVNRYQSFGCCHFSPVADAADMSGIAQRYGGEARSLAFFDADPDGLRRDGLPVTELAIDHRQRRRIDDEFDGLIGNDRAHLLPPDIDRHPDHAVAVVPREIRSREVGRDAPGFFRRRV